MKDKFVAIHQPNFFPWIGYFDKINKSEKFIFLDDVYLSAKGGTWSNRVQINLSGKKKWITAPITRKKKQKIKETLFNSSIWREKFKKTLQNHYSNANFFYKYKEFIFNLIDYNSNHLTNYNINLIKNICNFLEIDCKNKFMLSSSFNIASTSTERLLNLTKACNLKKYLSGDGSSEYLDEKQFIAHGITLKYQNFSHPVYYQKNSTNFIEGLSIIDAIFNIGKQTKEIFK